jgi:hypothetical protein
MFTNCSKCGRDLTCRVCRGSGKSQAAFCCGSKQIGNTCYKCGKVLLPIPCPSCHGKGLIVEPTSGGKRKRTSYTAFHLFLKISSFFKKDLQGLSVSDYRGKSYMSPVEIECLVKESGMSVLNLVEKDTHTFCVFKKNW